MKNLACIGVAISLVPCVAHAQGSAAPAAPAVPKHKCERPEYPGRLAPDRRIKQFNVELNAYKDCLQKFASDQKAIAQQHIDAGNAAITEYNDYAAELNKLFDRDPKDDKK